MSQAFRVERSATVSLFLVMAAVFAVYVGYGIVLPVLPFLLERLLDGATPSAIGWHTGLIAGIYMMALFLFAPFWGWVSDRVGRRPIILLGLGGCVTVVLLFGTANGLWVAYAARGVGGAFVSAVLPVALAYVGETSSPQARARRFAWMAAASTLGFLLGPVLGGWLVDVSAGEFSRPFLVAAAMGSIVWLAIWLWLPDAPRKRNPITPAVAGGHARLTLQAILLLALIGMFGLGSFEVAIALLGARELGMDPARIGTLFMVCSLVMVLVQVFGFSRLAARAGTERIVAAAFALMAFGLVVLPFATSFVAVLILTTLIGAGSGVVIPLLAYWTSLSVDRTQGAALGKQTAASSLGQGLGSATAGWLFGTAVAAPFWATAALLALGGLLGLIAGRSSRTDSGGRM